MAEEETLTAAEVNKMTVPQLKEALTSRGLDISGLKVCFYGMSRQETGRAQGPPPVPPGLGPLFAPVEDQTLAALARPIAALARPR